MLRETRHETTLIPPTTVIRAELARNVREGRRLRALLRLAVQSEEDRRFLEDLAERQAARGATGVAP